MSHDELRRRRENDDLLTRMRQGHNLCHTGLQSFRWAPRPTIKKDETEMARVYDAAPRAKLRVVGDPAANSGIGFVLAKDLVDDGK